MMPHETDLRVPLLGFRVAMTGLLAALILRLASYLINVLWLGPAHDALDVFRPEDDPLRWPGLMDLLHHLLASTLAGALIGALVPPRFPT